MEVATNNLLLYVSVVFLNSNKRYWFISDDLSVQIGDLLCVDVCGEIKVCKTVFKCMYTKENAPFPFDQTKHIVSKIDINSALEFITCQNVRLHSQYNDCGFFESSDYHSKNLPVPIYHELFKFADNWIIETKNPPKDIVERIVALPDDYKYANLFVTREHSEFIDDKFGGHVDSYKAPDGISVKSIVIPAGYKFVDLSGVSTRKLFISNNVDEIKIDKSFTFHCDVLLIPKDLKNIQRPKGMVGLGHIKRVFVDKKNPFFRLENGVLYYLNNNIKTVLWVSESIKRLKIDKSISYLDYYRQGLELDIEDNDFFRNHLDDLKKYSLIIVHKNDNVVEEYMNRYSNVIFDDEDVQGFIRCKKTFLINNNWVISGCFSKEDFYKFVSFDPKKNDGFVTYLTKKSDADKVPSSQIKSIVGLLKNELAPLSKLPIGRYEITVNELIEFNNGCINVLDFDNAYKTLFGQYEYKYLKYEIKSNCLDCEDLKNVREKIINLLAYDNISIDFENDHDKEKFILFMLNENYKKGLDSDLKEPFFMVDDFDGRRYVVVKLQSLGLSGPYGYQTFSAIKIDPSSIYDTVEIEYFRYCPEQDHTGQETVLYDDLDDDLF